MGLESVTSSLLAERTIVAIPVSVPAVPERKTPGAPGTTRNLYVSLDPPGVRRIRLALPAAFHGTWALIRLVEAKITGARLPFTARQDSDSASASAGSVAIPAVGLSCEP